MLIVVVASFIPHADGVLVSLATFAGIIIIFAITNVYLYMCMRTNICTIININFGSYNIDVNELAGCVLHRKGKLLSEKK